MTHDADRRAELIAAALTGELTAQESQEFDAACAADPSIRAELAELSEVSRRLGGADLTWREEVPPTALEARVLAAVDAEAGSGAGAGAGAGAGGPLGSSRRWRPAGMLAAAASLVAVGAIGAMVVQGLVTAPPDGPPGTLGAVEEISFTDIPAGGAIEAALIAHTWGTETLLEAEGLQLGETFEVVLVSTAGEEYSSGTFFATTETVVCRMNAAVLREDVAQVRIESADGAVAAVAELPAVSEAP